LQGNSWNRFDRLGMVTAVDLGFEFEMVYRVTSQALSSSAFVKDPHRAPRTQNRIAVRRVACRELAGARRSRPVRIEFVGHPDMRRSFCPMSGPAAASQGLRRSKRHPAADYI